MSLDNLMLEQYDTDKINSNYEHYNFILGHLRDREIKLLELGIYKGGSLLLWRDFFRLGTIIGIDINIPDTNFGDRIHVFKGSQADAAFLSDVSLRTAPEGFDIIIDDASHIGELTSRSFWHLFNKHLKPGGIYVIEDWGTGYWDDWCDGKSIHQGMFRLFELCRNLLARLNIFRLNCFKMPFKSNCYGMVGFIKQLVDEQGAADISKKRAVGAPARTSKFESMLIKPGVVFIKKATTAHDGA